MFLLIGEPENFLREVMGKIEPSVYKVIYDCK